MKWKSQIKTSEETIKEVKKETGETTLLSFSGGKDSIAAYLAIKDHFETIIPYYLYSIPGLSFIDDYLKYCEDMMGLKIIQIPSPSFYMQLENMVFQPPERIPVIQSIDWPKLSYRDIADSICSYCNISEKTYSAVGIRAPDSPQRRMAIEKHGTINHNQRKFYPVADWNKARLIDEIKKSEWKLSVDYEMFSRSYDGVDLRFLYPLRDRFPEDYQKILEWFPYAEFEILRYEYSQKGITWKESN